MITLFRLLVKMLLDFSFPYKFSYTSETEIFRFIAFYMSFLIHNIKFFLLVGSVGRFGRIRRRTNFAENIFWFG